MDPATYHKARTMSTAGRKIVTILTPTREVDAGERSLEVAGLPLLFPVEGCTGAGLLSVDIMRAEVSDACVLIRDVPGRESRAQLGSTALVAIEEDRQVGQGEEQGGELVAGHWSGRGEVKTGNALGDLDSLDQPDGGEVRGEVGHGSSHAASLGAGVFEGGAEGEGGRAFELGPLDSVHGWLR